jgi:hypothetical protein
MAITPTMKAERIRPNSERNGIVVPDFGDQHTQFIGGRAAPVAQGEVFGALRLFPRLDFDPEGPPCLTSS